MNDMTAGRFDRVHGDEGTYDPEPYRPRALDDVIETIMLFGQYPQPRHGRGLQARRAEFDLCDWIAENIEPCDVAQFLTWHICLHEDRDMLKINLEKRITDKLREELADSDMVNDAIAELHEQEREHAAS